MDFDPATMNPAAIVLPINQPSHNYENIFYYFLLFILISVFISFVYKM